MAVRSFSIPVSTILNTTSKIQINQTKTQRWIFGVIIGSAPFLFIVICWAIVNLCTSNLINYYQYLRKRHRYAKRKNINKTAIQTDAV